MAYIDKYTNQSAYDADETKQYPNVSYISGSDEVVFKMQADPEPVAFGGLTVKYNIVDPSVEVTLFNGGGSSSSSSSSSESGSGSGGGGALPTTMIVDGNEETPINTWRFDTTGEHIVQYEFEDDTVPQSFIDTSIVIAREIIVGVDIAVISSMAFDNYSLTSATCLSTTPPSIGDSSSFGGEYPIYVPAESVSAYQTAWSSLASRIQAIS